jgi:hypothetical protein
MGRPFQFGGLRAEGHPADDFEVEVVYHRSIQLSRILRRYLTK